MKAFKLYYSPHIYWAMTATTVEHIGSAFYLLAIVWILALVFFIITFPLGSNLGYVGLGLAAVFTIFMIVAEFDDSKPTESPLFEDELTTSDLYRYALLGTLITCSIISFLIFFTIYCISPVRPKQLQTF